mgnify:CR=1 FL=1
MMDKWSGSVIEDAGEFASFRLKHTMADHLFTLRVTMVKTRLQGKILYCCFVDFIKKN